MKQWEFLLSGSGGQGMVLAGLILAEGAVMAGKNAVQTQTYGPEARGGASKAEVIISEGEIDYPKVVRPDFLLAMSQDAYNKYAPIAAAYNSLVLVDGEFVTDLSYQLNNFIALPMTRAALERIGKPVVANMVALGAVMALTGVFSQHYLEEALLARVPKGSEQLNLEAFRLGVEIAREHQ